MSKIYTIAYRANAEGNHQVHVINDKDVRTPAAALAAFQATNPQALPIAVIDQEFLKEKLDRLTRIVHGQVGLAHKLHEFFSALPTEWLGTQAGDPTSLMQALTDLLKQSNQLLLLEGLRTITVTYGESGEFEICAETGLVLTPESEIDEPFTQYERCDIQEYLAWARSAGLLEPTSINALGLRWTHKSGQVEEAEMDWRNDLLEARGLGDRMSQPMDLVEWEGEVFHELCVQGEMSNGDAQGLTEARPSLFSELYFVHHLKPSAAAKRLLAPAN